MRKKNFFAAITFSLSLFCLATNCCQEKNEKRKIKYTPNCPYGTRQECRFRCGKKAARIYQHERFHCPNNKNREKRYHSGNCTHCKKYYKKVGDHEKRCKQNLANMLPTKKLPSPVQRHKIKKRTKQNPQCFFLRNIDLRKPFAFKKPLPQPFRTKDFLNLSDTGLLSEKPRFVDEKLPDYTMAPRKNSTCYPKTAISNFEPLIF